MHTVSEQPSAKMLLQLAIVVLATLQFGAAHENPEVPVVVVSQHQLRQDIRKEVTAVVQQATANITDSIDQVTRKVDWAVTDVIEPLRDEITAQVSSAIEDAITNVTAAIELLLEPLIDQLTPPASGKISTNPATSCEDVKVYDPTAPSGYYWVKAGNGSSIRVYCDMDRTCGGITGGWMRVANIDMKNTSHTCPQGLRQTTQQSKRLCTKTISTRGCSSAIFDVYGIEYTHVCGKVIGYQDKTPEAFDPYYANQSLTIDDVSVEGVILTHGTNPRKHIWTFAAALDEYGTNYNGQCPCMNTGSTGSTRIPPWVGSDYFCDTGSSTRFQYIFYSDDPLWDGEGCGPTNTCCSFNTPPWFSKQLPSTTTDSIELRICANQSQYDEDTPIEIVELYVQ